MRVRCLTATLAAGILVAAGATARSQTDDFFAKLDTSVSPLKARDPAQAYGSSGQSAKLEGHTTDALSIDKLLDRKGTSETTRGLAGVTFEDWAPDHRPGFAKAAVAGSSKPIAKSVDKAIDLDPDEAVKVPVPAPSHDPLDTRPTPGPAAGGAASPANSAGQAADALPPVDAAIKAALDKRAGVDIRGAHAGERRKERAAIEAFYMSHGFTPIWSKNGVAIAAVESILARLGRAGEDALDPLALPASLKVQGSPTEIAESDVGLTEAVVSYARQATGSRVDPISISPLIGARPQLADPAKVLGQLDEAGLEAGDILEGLNPTDPRYVALRQQLNQLHAARPAAAESDLPIPAGPTLRIGMRDPRVPLIRSRFSLDGVEADSSDLVYDTQIADAVADFQKANGLPASGILNRRTVAALSGGQPSRLDGTIVANMEMWRWMPSDLGRDRIEVNVPAFTVTVFHDGEAAASNRVVVGKTDTPTPLFSNTMKYLIVNPVWNVPQSIIKKEWGGTAPRGFDVSYNHGQLVVKQPSGAKNALGRIKFIFPNDYSVYLHDTPSKSLFAASKRAFSHGCVRVDQPFDFAEAVLNDSIPEGGDVLWSKKRLTSMLGDKERYVYLPEPLPIHIEYFTAVVDPDSGLLQMYDDVYGYIGKMAAALGKDGG